MLRLAHRLTALGLLALTLSLAAPVSSTAQEFATPLAQLDLQDGDTVVFLGDSITHQCLYTQYVEDYYFTRFPQRKVRFHNAGVGGARARDALDRFERDVAAYKPKYVTVLLGMNDGSYQPYDDPTFRTYKADMTELIGKIRAIGAVPVLMTPTMYDSRAARLRGGNTAANPARLELYNATLAYFGAWLREYAVENGCGFVDMYGPLNHVTLLQRKSDPRFTLIKDAVHPDAPGQVVMAFALLEDLASPRLVSNLRVMMTTESEPQIVATGGSAAQAKILPGGGIEFQWTADSLPWVLPEDAALGFKLLRAGHRLSREALEVHGLPTGRYELTIDGQSVGIFPTERLETHIELQENTKTPQYQQAFQVAALNKQRNDTAIRPLRNEWSRMQQYYRLNRQAASDANNTEFLKKRDDQARVVEGLDDRIAALEKAAAELEAQIRAAAQPKTRVYRLTPVASSQPQDKS
ncbi:MAG: SGNH/GDSL hydrolase family protein [Pirellulaceae bacterium]